VSQDTSKTVGYREEEMKTVCEGANSGLGCGSLIVPASLKTGGTVLDLGSGAGFDCFPAAREVGVKGKVIGVDMTPEMLDRTREDVRTGKYKNVEFMLGEIENLPVANRSVDVIISNCVINLSPDKAGVFAECLSLAAG
jgi:ubiquinone/menaquinone biosynthesis C-methylase UbiE